MYSAQCNWAFPQLGFPIRTSTDQRLLGTSPWLIAPCNVLLRHILSSHPPYTLNALCSLIAHDAGRKRSVNFFYTLLFGSVPLFASITSVANSVTALRFNCERSERRVRRCRALFSDVRKLWTQKSRLREIHLPSPSFSRVNISRWLW